MSDCHHRESAASAPCHVRAASPPVIKWQETAVVSDSGHCDKRQAWMFEGDVHCQTSGLPPAVYPCHGGRAKKPNANDLEGSTASMHNNCWPKSVIAWKVHLDAYSGMAKKRPACCCICWPNSITTLPFCMVSLGLRTCDGCVYIGTRHQAPAYDC